MKTIKLTDKQFQELHTYVIDTCEDIMDRSLEWADSDLSNEIIDDNEIVFTLRSILLWEAFSSLASPSLSA